MGRYREIRTGAELAKLYPYIVEQVVPPFGFGPQLLRIEDWVSKRVRRNQFGRWGRYRDGQDIAVWGFQDAALAAEFRLHIDRVLQGTSPRSRARG